MYLRLFRDFLCIHNVYKMTGRLEETFSYLGVTNQVVTFKYNIPDPVPECITGNLLVDPVPWTEAEMWEFARPHFHTAFNFLQDRFDGVLACSVGLHLHGVNAKPHAHFHFVVNRQYKTRSSSCICNEKMAWCRRQKDCYTSECNMKNMTVKFEPLDISKPKWQTLSYPLKERLRGDIEMYLMMRDGALAPMQVEVIDLLENVGGQLFDAALALRERKEKAEKAQEDNLEELYNIALKNRACFSTFRQMQEYLEDIYIGNKKLHELPVAKNYNNNIKKVGRMLGIFRYCDDSSAF